MDTGGDGSESRLLPPEMRSQTVRLPDRHKLGVLQCGDPAGFPVFYFHGFGSSRLGVHPNDLLTRMLGVRLIAVDRPGIGLSDPRPGRRVADWAKDVSYLADTLGLDRFSVMGYSAGGAFALACAACLPERVLSATLVSSTAPMDDPALRALHNPSWQRMARVGRLAPWLVRSMFDRVAREAQRNPNSVMENALEEMLPADRELASQPAYYTSILLSAQEAYTQGGQGAAGDALALIRPWGFKLSSVRPPVVLWHGEEDQNWPVTLGQYLAQSIPARHANFLPGEGHLIYLAHWAEILQSMLALRE